MRHKAVKEYGFSFMDALQILFIALKLTGVIDWSWWWVLSPLWGSIALALLLLIGSVVIAAIKDI